MGELDRGVKNEQYKKLALRNAFKFLWRIYTQQLIGPSKQCVELGQTRASHTASYADGESDSVRNREEDQEIGDYGTVVI